MKKIFIIMSLICILACNRDNEDSTKQATTDPEPLKQTVSVTSVELGEISHYLFSTGTVEAEESVEVFPKISGYVQNILKDQGDHVTANTPLMKLEDVEWQMKVKEADLEISTFQQKEQQALLNIRSLEKQLIQADLNIKELQDTVEQTELNLHQATLDYKRNTERYQKQLISEDVYQETRYSYERALLEKKGNIVKLERAKVSKDDTAISLQRAKLEIKALEAERSRAQFALDRAKLEQSYTEILAPFNGIIAYRSANRGQLVSSQTKVFSIVNLDKLIVRLNISEKDLLLLEKQQVVVLDNDNFPGMKETGIVRCVCPVVDSNSGTVQVIVDIKSKQHKLLRPGIFVKASVEVEKNPQALLVPRKAIVYERDRKAVFVVEKDRVKKHIIETGIQSLDFIEVISGVSEHDKIVIKGQHLLQDNQAVRILEDQSNPSGHVSQDTQKSTEKKDIDKQARRKERREKRREKQKQKDTESASDI